MPDKNRKPVTIRTVATDAGVSVAAVSKVLRNAYGVSRELRSKVEASVARLGYRPRPAARAMRGKSYTLGIVFPDIRNPFFTDILDGANAALERTQYRSLLGISQSELSVEMAVVDLMADWQMDGIVLVGARMTPEEMAVVGGKIPTVAIAHHEPSATLFDTVNNNDRLGARLVVEHLAAGGHRRIAFLNLLVTGLGIVGVTGQRELGYQETMAELGLGQYRQVVHAEQTSREIQLAAKHMLTAAHRPDAIFCWTDFVAFEVLSVARDLGLAVPGDLAVVGYDNTGSCDLAQNALTSVDQSGQVLGLQAARLLIERVSGRAGGEHFVVTPRLVVRKSSAGRR